MTKNNINFSNLKKYSVVIFSLIIIFFITLSFPYTGDDISWSLKNISFNFIEFTNTTSNGRYLGNIFAIIMTKNVIFKSVIMSVVLVAIAEIIKKETGTKAYLRWLFLLLMPLPIFSQAIVWTSGFTNYVISTLFLLLSLILIRKIYNERTKKYYYLLETVLLFLTSLFIENISVFMFVFTFILNIIYFIKNRKININLLFAFFGTLIGNLVMFSHPSYHNVINGTDTYRSYATGLIGLIKTIIQNYSSNISLYTISNNVFLICILTYILHIFYKDNQNKFSKKHKSILNKCILYMIIYSIHVVINYLNNNWNQYIKYSYYLESLSSVIYIIALIISLILLFYKTKLRKKIFSIIVVICGLLVPLFIVNPIGPRNFFMIYVLEIILIFYILNIANFDYKKHARLIYAIIGIICIQYVSIYAYINYFEYKRKNYVVYKSNNTEDKIVYLPKMPFKNYVWAGDYSDEFHSNKYKEKYNIRGNIEFKFIDYSS